MNRYSNTPSRGFTLIEAVVSIVTVGVMLAAAVTTIGSAAQSRAQATWLQSAGLARYLLGEVMQTRYEDPNSVAGFGPESGESSRKFFDDVDDFHGLNEKPILDRLGVSIPSYTAWSWTVNVAWVDPADPGGAVVGSETTLKRIVVKVIAPGGQATSHTGLRSRWSTYEELSAAGSGQDQLMWVGVSIQSGKGVTERPYLLGTDLVNLPVAD